MYAVRTWDEIPHRPLATVEEAIAYARSYLWKTCGHEPGQVIFDSGRCEPDGTEVRLLVMCEGDAEHKLPFWAEVYPDS